MPRTTCDTERKNKQKSDLEDALAVPTAIKKKKAVIWQAAARISTNYGILLGQTELVKRLLYIQDFRSLFYFSIP